MLLPSLVLPIYLITNLVDASLLQKSFSLAGTSTVEQIRGRAYADQLVLRLNVDTLEDTQEVYRASETLGLDVWSSTDEHIDLRVPKDTVTKLFDAMPEHLRNATTHLIPDLQHAIQRSVPCDFATNFLNERVPSINDTFFSDFQTVEAIDAWLALVVAMHAPTASLINLGQTHEGRAIKGLRLSQPRSTSEKLRGKKRKVILVHGAQHAREWISVSTVCYLAYSLAAGAGTDLEIRKLVQDFDWIFIPTLNVDGYAYSFQDRLWRKNRQPTTVPFCKGVDLDRNWAFGWEGKSSQRIQSSPCSENYEGTEAFEAVETRLLSDYIQSFHNDPNYKLVGYLDLHSYAQTILYPYALSCDLDVRDEESLIELGVGASKAMKASSGEHYETASACNQDGHVLATANGGAALDWVYHSGVPWSYVVKLRDTGSYGFLVPKDEIVPTGEEMLNFVKYFGSFITEHSH